MYTLYYLNRNLQLDTLEVSNLDRNILIPEDLIFCNLRKGITFIKEPHECIDFTPLERLIISSEFNDTSLIKDGDYRKQNSYLSPLCLIGSRVLTVDYATQTTATVINVAEDVKNRIFSCSGDLGITMHIISLDGIERKYANVTWMNFEWNEMIQGFQVNVIEPFEIVKIWFSDNHGDYADSNTYEVII